MTSTPNNPPQRLEDLVSSWLSNLPRWTYSSDANFYDALVFLRRRIQAMDKVQSKANKWLMSQDEALLGLLKVRLLELGKLANQPETKDIFLDIETALRSRLLRSRADGRELTKMALHKLIFQLRNVEEKFLENGDVKTSDEYKQFKLLTNQCRDLLQRLQEDDLLYKSFEPARSVLNAFKQQKSVVIEILSWYDIPDTEENLLIQELSNSTRRSEKKLLPPERKIVNDKEELFSLDASNEHSLMIALRQAYFLFFWNDRGVPMHVGNLVSVVEEDGKVSKIGTKGHEWEAFVSSAFDIQEPIFLTARSIDKRARNFEVRLVSKLDQLQRSIKQSQSKVEAELAKAINDAKIDIQLKPNNEVQYEIVMEPQSGVFQRICYQMSSIFRPQVEDLWVDLAAEIHKKFGTREFRVSIESKEPSLVTIVLDFPTDLGSLRTEIHKFVRDNLQKLRVGLNLKFDR